MRKVDIIIIAVIMTVLLGGAVTALIVVNLPSPPPDAISITTQPTRTTYARGERINTSGLVLSALFPDESTRTNITSGFTITPEIASNGPLGSLGTVQQEVTVTWRGKSTTFEITVGPATLERIEIVRFPTKRRYAINETPNWVGLQIRQVWTDRTDVINYPHAGLSVTLPPNSMSTTGTRTVTVTYQERTTTFTINVV